MTLPIERDGQIECLDQMIYRELDLWMGGGSNIRIMVFRLKANEEALVKVDRVGELESSMRRIV
jgi:hypothetical protein